MKNAHYLLFLILFISACQSAPEEKNFQSGQAEKTLSSNMAQKQIAFLFSDSTQADTFKVVLEGKDSKNAFLVFSIMQHNGQQIYQQKISGAELIKGNTKLKNEAARMNYLRNEVAYFFDEEHLLEPAVMPDEAPDKNVPDKAFYNELKSTGLNGFSFHTGIETTVYIAWSVKTQTVKVFYKCC